MTSVFTLEDFQNLVRNDFKDKEIKPLIEALENLLIDSDEFTKDDFVLCCNIVPPVQYFQTLLHAVRNDDEGTAAKSNLKRIVDVFRRIPILKTEDEKYALYDRTIKGDCKVSFHYKHSRWDYYISGLYKENVVGYQLVDSNPNYLFSGEGDLHGLLVIPDIKLDFTALEEKTLEQLIQEQYLVEKVS